MCGIVGVLGARPAAPLLLDALQRLEYRGYDSAGIATLANGHIERRRAPGKLHNLAAVLRHSPMPGTTGVGHTRWATHGAPTETNAHPHGTARVSVVHNGIIENHAALRHELEAAGQVFETETDTETVAMMLDLHLQRGMAPVDAAQATFARLEGAYALAVVFAGQHGLMIGAQHGAPLAVGFGEDEMFLGSDSLALAPLTQRIAFLRDGDWAVLSRSGARVFDRAGQDVQRRGAAHRPHGHGDRQGRLPPLHGKGAARAPERHRPGAAAHGRPCDAHRRPARVAVRPGLPSARDGDGVRQRILRGPGRPALAGGRGAAADRCGRRQRAALPRAAAAAGRARPAGEPVGRDGGHPGRLALPARRRAARAQHPERAGKQHGARE